MYEMKQSNDKINNLLSVMLLFQREIYKARVCC